MQRFGKYQVVEKIGEGGFGVVWEGFDPQIRRRVAIKTCTSQDRTARQRFFREAEIAGNLHHRNITIVYDVGQEDGVPYMVQEFLTGEDLDRKIRRRDDLSFTTKLLYLLQIARGLEYAHEQGVIHRDVKPSNIRVLDDGMVKIMDFGIARTDEASQELTAVGQTVGTAAYLSPEQIRLSKADRRSDIHAFGVTAYELLTYERAFPGDDAMAVMQSILTREPRPIGELWAECPRSLDRLVKRCCRKEPGDRFQVVGELLPRLTALNEQPPGTDPKGVALRPTPPPRSTAAEPGKAQRAEKAEKPEKAKKARKETRTAPQRPRIEPNPTPSSPIEQVSLAGRDRPSSGVRSPPPATAVRRSSLLPYLLLLVFMGLVGGGAAYWYFTWQQPSAMASPEIETAAGGNELGPGPVAADDRGAADDLGTADDPGAADDPGVAGDPGPADDPEYATLVIEPGWDQAIEVSVSNQPAVRLDVTRRFRLRPDVDHHLEFTLLTEAYQATADDSLRLAPGEERTLQPPIPRPGAITVRAALRSPQVFVRVDGTALGWTPVREHLLAPGEHLVRVASASTPAGGSAQEYGISVRSGLQLVLTFDLREDRPPTVVERELFR